MLIKTTTNKHYNCAILVSEHHTYNIFNDISHSKDQQFFQDQEQEKYKA